MNVKEPKAIIQRISVKKRTSIGGKHFPSNKHKRRNFGKHLYRGQGKRH